MFDAMMRILLLIPLCCNMLPGLGNISAYGQDGTAVRTEEPCSVLTSFLFTSEDVTPGSAVMTLPTDHGETWSLIETESRGYLALDNSHSSYSWIIFSRSPDLETISQSSGKRSQSFPFVLVCSFHGWIYKYKQELIIADVNEHAPVFDLARSYNINVSESESVGASIFSLRHLASDPDTTGQVSFYSLEPHLESHHDGRQYFRISDDGNHILLWQPVDFEKLLLQGHVILKLNLSATDNGTPFSLSSYTTVTVQVIDVDDQGPAFVYADCEKADNFCTLPYFQTAVKCSFQGVLRLYPGHIQAVDRDTQNHSISYSISGVEPNKFLEKLKINKWTGEIQVVGSSCFSNVDEFVVIVTATESSLLEHSISTNLEVKLLDSLVFPNMARNLQADSDHVSPPSSSLTLTFFLVALFGLIIAGSVMAFIAVRISQNKQQNKIDASGIVASESCQQSNLSTPTIFSQKHIFKSLYGDHTNGPKCKLSTNSAGPLETISYPPQGELEPLEMWTAFRTSSNTHFLSEISDFSPSISLPGHIDPSCFYDGNSSFGSMKHERILQATRADMKHVGKLKLKLTSVVPDFLKLSNQRNRFNTSNLSQSSV